MNYAGEEHMEALKKVERASVADLQPLVVEIEAEGITSLIETVRKAESQAEDFRAEMISQIKTELAAEDLQKAEDNTLNAESWTDSFKSYGPVVLCMGTLLVGVSVISKWK